MAQAITVLPSMEMVKVVPLRYKLAHLAILRIESQEMFGPQGLHANICKKYLQIFAVWCRLA